MSVVTGDVPSDKIRMKRRDLMRGLVVSAGAGVLAGCSTPLALPQFAPPPSPAMRVASFNIRYIDLTEPLQTNSRSLRNWQARRRAVVSALRGINADIMAFQEMESWDGTPQSGAPIQRTWLSSQMPEYSSASCTCSDGLESGQPIFFRHARFSVIEEGTTPIGTVIGPALERAHIRAAAIAGYSDVVSWARFRDRMTGEYLMVVNLHLHFVNQLRQEGAAQLAVQIARAAIERDDHVVVLGDLNVVASARPLRVMRDGNLTLIPSEGASFHFDTGLHLYGAIDHILHGPRLRAMGTTQVLRGQVEGVWPSDHYPIWVDLQPI